MNKPSPQRARFLALASRPIGIATTDPVEGITAQQLRSQVHPLRKQLHSLVISHKVKRHFATAQLLADYIADRPAIQALAERQRTATTHHQPSHQLRIAAAVVVPDHITVQRCPTPRGRYEAEPGYQGEFSRQWQEQRAAA